MTLCVESERQGAAAFAVGKERSRCSVCTFKPGFDAERTVEVFGQFGKCRACAVECQTGNGFLKDGGIQDTADAEIVLRQHPGLNIFVERNRNFVACG